MNVVFVNGCFDVLHVGHVQLLTYARGLGDRLVVAIDGDLRVAEAKGPGRPYNTEADRRTMLLALKPVDHVESFGSDGELRALVAKHRPRYMVVGGDWQGRAVIGSEHAGELIYFNRIGNYSTSNILANRSTR
jgi:D-beta-D-heptose 7-phosphate kinase/D-beta-D-heptose 1-phosphate adenosyltransferase